MSKDLSYEHQPITNLFPTLSNREDSARYALSADHVEQFGSTGYLAGVRLLDEQQVDALRGEIAELMTPGHPGSELWYEHHSNESTDPNSVLFHALGAWRLRPALHDILWNAPFVAACEQLLGGRVRFWHDQLFSKPARHGGVVAWHQDYSYWTRTTPMQHLTCWIGLDDSTTENGCVHYVEGSHRWPLLPTTNLANDMDAIKGVLSPAQLNDFDPKPCELAAGEASFHHPMMLHGSYENRSERPRRAIVLNVVLDGACSAQDEPLLSGVDPIPAGAPLGGRFFPMLSIDEA